MNTVYLSDEFSIWWENQLILILNVGARGDTSMNNPVSATLRDFLTDTARKERKLLLVTSAVGIAVAQVGLLPLKVSALGVEFSSTDQHAFLVLLALIVGYFFFAFFLYAMADFLAWRNAVVSVRLAIMDDIKSWTDDEFSKKYRDIFPRGSDEEKLLASLIEKEVANETLLLKLSGPAAYSRAVFDFLVPLAVGGYSIFAIVRQAIFIASQQRHAGERLAPPPGALR